MFDYGLLDIGNLTDPEEDWSQLSSVPAWRRDYILRYRNSEDRKRSLGAWLLLEKMLDCHGFSADKVRADGNGRLSCEGIYFSLSHSGEKVLCAVSDTPVGCDIEKLKKAPLAVAERAFTEKERQYMGAKQSFTETNRRFFELWTMKESYLKMTGEGLSFPMNRLEADPIKATVLRDAVLQPCKIQSISLDGYQISICLSNE